MSEDKDLEFNENKVSAAEYGDDSIRHLSDVEHIRLRPGMYIGKLGRGAHPPAPGYVHRKTRRRFAER